MRGRSIIIAQRPDFHRPLDRWRQISFSARSSYQGSLDSSKKHRDQATVLFGLPAKSGHRTFALTVTIWSLAWDPWALLVLTPTPILVAKQLSQNEHLNTGVARSSVPAIPTPTWLPPAAVWDPTAIRGSPRFGHLYRFCSGTPSLSVTFEDRTIGTFTRLFGHFRSLPLQFVHNSRHPNICVIQDLPSPDRHLFSLFLRLEYWPQNSLLDTKSRGQRWALHNSSIAIAIGALALLSFFYGYVFWPSPGRLG